MDEVFTIVRVDREDKSEMFLHSSKDIYVILDEIFRWDATFIRDLRVYVTDDKGDSVLWKKWRVK